MVSDEGDEEETLDEELERLREIADLNEGTRRVYRILHRGWMWDARLTNDIARARNGRRPYRRSTR